MSSVPVTEIRFPVPGAKHEAEEGTIFAPRFGADGTLTCVTIDAENGHVLMVGHMNAEALALTIQTGEGWYWSRSRNELWHKGATSGNVQKVVELLTDCDQDAVVMKVRVEGHGATCHTGRESCFYRQIPLGQTGPAVSLIETDSHRHFDPAEVYGK